MSLDLIYQEIQLIRADIKQLKQEIARYKGFVLGVIWCLGALASILAYLGRI